VVVKTNAYNNAGGNNPWMMRNVQLLRRMDRELDLTPEQHTHIEAIIKESQERIKGLMRSVQPLMNKEMQETRSEIIKELTPEQQKKFEDFPHHPNAERRHGETNTAPINQSATGTNSVSTNAP
jgi:Spy/CpxP family protein refolding chaperone